MSEKQVLVVDDGSRSSDATMATLAGLYGAVLPYMPRGAEFAPRVIKPKPEHHPHQGKRERERRMKRQEETK